MQVRYIELFKSKIILHEIDNIEHYLKEGEPGWPLICLSNNFKVHREPRGKAYFITYGNVKLLISSKDACAEPRDIYAHAGLAYGIKWFAIINNARPVLCLGEENLRSKLI